MHRSAELKMQSLKSTQSPIEWLEVVSWGLWEAPRIWPQRLCFQAGVTNIMAMWGKSKFAFGKFEKGEDKLQDCIRERSQLCFMVSKAFDQRLSEGSCLGLVKVH